MLKADAANIHAIEAAANRFPWSVKNFEDSLDAGHHGWVYCDNQGLIVGYTIMQLILDEAHLLNICVRPDKQRQGYGLEILTHVIEFARSCQATLIVLEVRASNWSAKKLYEWQGFNEMSIRRNYYPAEQGREDAILMGLDISM